MNQIIYFDDISFFFFFHRGSVAGYSLLSEMGEDPSKRRRAILEDNDTLAGIEA